MCEAIAEVYTNTTFQCICPASQHTSVTGCALVHLLPGDCWKVAANSGFLNIFSCLFFNFLNVCTVHFPP